MKTDEKKRLVLMILTGFFIGIAAIAPGVSGTAFAVVFGLYEPITDAVAHIWQDFRQKVRFLAPLAIGAAVGMLLFGWLIAWAFEKYPDYMKALFLGLIVGTLPSVFRTASKGGFRWYYLIPLLTCGGLIAWVTSLEGLHFQGETTEFPYWMALACGGLVGFGSVFPGVSAAFILMALGVYEPMMGALRTYDILRLLLIGVGFCGAVLLFTRFVSWAYKKAHGIMSFAAAGMMLGSMVMAVPTPRFDLSGLIMLALLAGGALLSWWMVKLESFNNAGTPAEDTKETEEV